MADRRIEVHHKNGCLDDLLLLLIVMILVSYCNRSDKNKNIVDSTIESVYVVSTYVDSVWNSCDSVYRYGR